jgi:uncharacterized protein YaaW (UPF0174 family)
MSNDINQELDQLRQKISDAQTRKTRAELIKEQAEARIEQSSSLLREKFKVENTEEAKALVAKLDEKMSLQIAEAEKALAEASDG